MVDLEALARVFRQAAAPLAEAFRALGEALGPLVGQLRKLAGDGPPPTDMWERALWLRRHRNTGPVQVRRVPRRVDSGFGLCLVARGRPPYRPMRAR